MNTTYADEDKLYRFISYKQLLDIIVNGRFTFVKYKLFDDPWEGFFHKAFFKIDEFNSYNVLGENRPFIMCFTERKDSDAMWRIYSQQSSGVQISTTVSKLKRLVSDVTGFDCYLRNVIYDDEIMNEDFFIKNYPTSSMKEKIVKCLFHKRKAFDHEQEARLVLYSQSDRDEDIYHVYADPNEIIEKIFLDPRIDKKAEDLHIMALSRLGFKNVVAKSPLYNFRRIWYKIGERL